MYSLVRRYIKTAIGFLIVGRGIGGWMIVRREFRQQFPTPYETSAHTHAIFVGFVMMMICGVSLWLFPRPEKHDRRYRPSLAEAAYWMLATGTSARITGELTRNRTAAAWLSATIVGAAMLQMLGLALFFYTMWSRIQVSEASHARPTASASGHPAIRAHGHLVFSGPCRRIGNGCRRAGSRASCLCCSRASSSERRGTIDATWSRSASLIPLALVALALLVP